MKPQRINYRIEEPCHADWDRMKPETTGRFCSECSKTVVDFSSMSDFSILRYLENHKGQSVCGRFTESQLDKTYVWTKSHSGLFQFDLKAVALGLALSTFSAIPSQAQNKLGMEQVDTTAVETVPMKQGEVTLVYDHKEESFVSGKVKLEGKSSGAIRISLLDGNSKELTSVEAAKNGTFRIPLDWKDHPVAIRATAPGHSSQTLYFENHRSLKDLEIGLYDRTMIKGKVIREDD